MSEPRRPGRPRDARAEQAILDAAFDLIEEVGFSGLTVDAVAARAGVGKATIYRRWTSKEALVVAAAKGSKGGPGEAVDTGDLRADLIAAWRRTADHLRHERHGRVMPALVAEAATNPELAKLLHELSVERRANIRRLVESAMARGDLSSEVDADLAVEMFVAPLFYRRLVSGAPLNIADAEPVVDYLLDGLREIGKDKRGRRE